MITPRRLYTGPRPNYMTGVQQPKVGSQRGELKAFDITGTSSAFTNTGTFTAFNTPVVGSELYQRIGRKIYMKSLVVRGNIDGTAANVNDQIRIMIIYDRQSNAGIPNQLAILQDSNAAGGTTSVYSSINLTNRSRFLILKDFFLNIPSATTFPGGIGVDQTKDFTVEWYIPLKGLETEFNGTNGGTIADITTGSLFMVTFDQQNTGTYTFNYGTRLRYYDT